MSEDLKALGRAVRHARTRKHMTQRQLAEAAGVYFGTISNFELGKTTPQPDHLRAILAVLELDDRGVPLSPPEPEEGGCGDPACINRVHIKLPMPVHLFGHIAMAMPKGTMWVQGGPGYAGIPGHAELHVPHDWEPPDPDALPHLPDFVEDPPARRKD